MIVDAHAHFFDDGYLPTAFHMETARKWAAAAPGRKAEDMYSKIQPGLNDPGGKMFIENMDRAGVDATVFMMADFGISYGEDPPKPAKQQVEELSELAKKYKGRWYNFGISDVRRKGALDFVKWAIRDKGFKGFGEMSPEGFPADDEMLFPFYKLCIELGVPANIHTRAGTGVEVAQKDEPRLQVAHPRHVSLVKQKFPELNIIMAHAGYPVWWQDAVEVAKGHPNSYLELSDWEHEIKTPETFVPKLAKMRDSVGADHIMFATDHVTGSRFCLDKSFLPAYVKFFEELPDMAPKYGERFTKKEVDLILGDNAQRIMRL